MTKSQWPIDERIISDPTGQLPLFTVTGVSRSNHAGTRPEGQDPQFRYTHTWQLRLFQLPRDRSNYQVGSGYVALWGGEAHLRIELIVLSTDAPIGQQYGAGDLVIRVDTGEDRYAFFTDGSGGTNRFARFTKQRTAQDEFPGAIPIRLANYYEDQEPVIAMSGTGSNIDTIDFEIYTDGRRGAEGDDGVILRLRNPSSATPEQLGVGIPSGGGATPPPGSPYLAGSGTAPATPTVAVQSFDADELIDTGSTEEPGPYKVTLTYPQAKATGRVAVSVDDPNATISIARWNGSQVVPATGESTTEFGRTAIFRASPNLATLITVTTPQRPATGLRVAYTDPDSRTLAQTDQDAVKMGTAVAWSPPEHTGGGIITGYVLHTYVPGVRLTRKTFPATARSAVVASTAPLGAQFWVTATTKVGESLPARSGAVLFALTDPAGATVVPVIAVESFGAGLRLSYADPGANWSDLRVAVYPEGATTVYPALPVTLPVTLTSDTQQNPLVAGGKYSVQVVVTDSAGAPQGRVVVTGAPTPTIDYTPDDSPSTFFSLISVFTDDSAFAETGQISWTVNARSYRNPIRMTIRTPGQPAYAFAPIMSQSGITILRFPAVLGVSTWEIADGNDLNSLPYAATDGATTHLVPYDPP